jgi:hypothetical protein
MGQLCDAKTVKPYPHPSDPPARLLLGGLAALMILVAMILAYAWFAPSY